MITLARLLIFADVCLPIVYIVSPKFTVFRILAVLLTVTVIVFGMSRSPISERSLSIFKWALALIMFKLVLDSTLHSDGTLNSVTQFFREFFVVIMLPLMEKIGDRSIRIVKFVLISSVPAMLLGTAQIFNGSFTLQNLVPTNPAISVIEISNFYIEITSRIVGPYNIAIGFAMLLGFLFMIGWSKVITSKNFNTKIAYLVLMAISFVLMIFTQTRSAIYGVFPTMLLTYLLATPNLAKRLSYTVIGSLVIIIGFAGFQAYITTYSERSQIRVDSSTYYKITANVYGTYAALARDPLFGVPVNRDRDASDQEYLELIKEGKAALGSFLKTDDQFKLGATNHNLFAYYLRYYGLVGFALLTALIFKMYRACMLEKDLQLRYMKLGILVYFLQYAMLHNNQILETLMLWIILACTTSTGQSNNEPEPVSEGIGPDVRLQRRPASLVSSRKHTGSILP